MNDNERREAAEKKIAITLMRHHPGLKDGELYYLMESAKQTVEFSDHVKHGDALELSQIVAACERSDVGQMIFHRDRDDEDGRAGPVDHERATEGMSAQQKLIYAREHGLR